MIALLLFMAYIILGLILANVILPTKRPVVRAWAGGVIGIVGLMWSNIPFSFIFGFSVISHLLGFGLFALLTVALFFVRKRSNAKHAESTLEFGQLNSMQQLIGKWRVPFEKGEKAMLLLLVPFMIFAVICLLNHSFYEIDGVYYTGQATYGDINFHLGIITSMKEQQTFPPDYSICPGEQLDYYFLCDSVSSSLYMFGMGLRTAYIFPMIFGFLLVFVGLWILARTVLASAAKAHTAFVLFFLNGGFGLMYFLDNLRKDKGNFTQIFTEFYHTPTNYVNSQGSTTNICWTNTVVDMMLPQRATLFGWMILFLTIYLLYLAVFENGIGGNKQADGEKTQSPSKSSNLFIAAGVLAGLTPMIQTYSYFTIGMIAVAWIVYTALRDKFNKTFIISWLKFGIPALVLSIPQLYMWVFGAVDGESFIRFGFNAYNESDNWLWFWVKNVGVVFILLIPAFMNCSRKLKAFYSAGLLIFIITEFVQFQTYAYDNNKLYLMWYAFSTFIVADFLVKCYHKLAGMRGRNVMAIIVLVLCVNAAVLTMAREMYSGFRPQSYVLYSRDGVSAAEFIRENTEPDSLFLSYNNHNNVISCLTGRNIFVGSGTFLNSHDVGYREREAALSQIFNNADVFEQYKTEYGFDYVYISAAERNLASDTFIDEYLRETYEIVYDSGGVVIFRCS